MTVEEWYKMRKEQIPQERGEKARVTWDVFGEFARMEVEMFLSVLVVVEENKKRS